MTPDNWFRLEAHKHRIAGWCAMTTAGLWGVITARDSRAPARISEDRHA